MRICPICDTRTEKERCPNDGYMTIDIEQFQTGANKDPNIGKVLKEQYRIVELLGQGGMGSVYKGVNIPLRQDVAIKVMDPIVRQKLEQVKRFHVEALATSRLRHPNTVRVFDFGQEHDGTIFLVMEFLEGRSLEEALLKDGRFKCKRALKIFRMAMGSLAEAHSYGIVHRDLKPSNIMLTDMPGARDFVKVVDFGIAKILQGAGMEKGLTKTGMIIGSPEYMSPEQIGGKPVDARTDLYSLGLVMYRMISGQLPYTGDTPITVMVKQGTEPLPPFSAEILREMPVGLNELIHRVTEKAPDKRPASAQAVLDALDHLGPPGGQRSKTVKTPLPVSKPAPQQKKTGSITGKAIDQMETSLFEADFVDDRPDDIFVAKRPFPWVIVVIALAVLVAGGVFLMFSHGQKTPNSPKIALVTKKAVSHKKAVKSVVPSKKFVPPNLRSAFIKPRLSARKPLAQIKIIKPAKPVPKPAQKVKNTEKPVPVKIVYKTVVVDSSPAKASVWVRGRNKGDTPGARIKIPKGKSLYVTIKKSGYKQKRIRLNSRKKHVKVDLEPILF